MIRGLFLLTTIFALPCWLVAVLEAQGSWRTMLGVQKWVLALGVVLMLWQNPIDSIAEMAPTVSLRTRFVSAMCGSFAEAFFYVFWLNLLDLHGSALKGRLVSKLLFGLVLLAVDTGMTVIRMPALFHIGEEHRSVPTKSEKDDELYTLLGFLRIAMMLGWVVWIVRIGWRTGVYLRQLPYMLTRFQQLSFRFLFLETLMILIYVLVLSGLQVFNLCQAWYLLGYGPFIQSAVHTFAKYQSGHPSLGKLVFLSVYVYLVMFVHLPPSTGDSTGLLTSTAFHVEERPRMDRYGFLTPDSHLFCVETAAWLLELAWQAYFDPPGRPSTSGYGELNLEPYGFELVTHLRSSLTDTHVVVALSHEHKRLVVAFRGTTSRENWKSNLRFHQKVLWVKSRGRWRKRTCMEATTDCLSKIPLLNMALPRVHSGAIVLRCGGAARVRVSYEGDAVCVWDDVHALSRVLEGVCVCSRRAEGGDATDPGREPGRHRVRDWTQHGRRAGGPCGVRPRSELQHEGQHVQLWWSARRQPELLPPLRQVRSVELPRRDGRRHRAWRSSLCAYLFSVSMFSRCIWRLTNLLHLFAVGALPACWHGGGDRRGGQPHRRPEFHRAAPARVVKDQDRDARDERVPELGR